MLLEARPYQRQANDVVFAVFANSQSARVVMPTGTAKTALLALVAERFRPQGRTPTKLLEKGHEARPSISRGERDAPATGGRHAVPIY